MSTPHARPQRAARVGRRLTRSVVPAAAIISLAVCASLPLAAQSPAGPSQSTAPGWVFTPGVAVAETWDNNVLLATDSSGTTFLDHMVPGLNLNVIWTAC